MVSLSDWYQWSLYGWYGQGVHACTNRNFVTTLGFIQMRFCRLMGMVSTIGLCLPGNHIFSSRRTPRILMVKLLLELLLGTIFGKYVQDSLGRPDWNQSLVPDISFVDPPRFNQICAVMHEKLIMEIMQVFSPRPRYSLDIHFNFRYHGICIVGTHAWTTRIVLLNDWNVETKQSYISRQAIFGCPFIVRFNHVC